MSKIKQLFTGPHKTISRNVTTAISLWLISVILLQLGAAEGELMLALGIMIPFSILLYTWSFFFAIPAAIKRKHPFLSYALRVILLLILCAVPLGLLFSFYLKNVEDGVSFVLVNSFIQLFIATPICWQLYKRYRKQNDEVYALQKELGKSVAGLHFLRSQINPHFLFNALNTLYGTAIQENAERTSEGIQKLGDMMRFMLQDNLQEKTSLSRELDYLHNYINLQKLRTDTSPMIKIEVDIQEEIRNVQIAPMLLIPFVENAFKHGISFREHSLIRINLEMKETKLFFDVYNLKHEKKDDDPERDKSGIGLNNVKQRLQMMYRYKHELVVRETGKEFFVHLTLEL